MLIFATHDIITFSISSIYGIHHLKAKLGKPTWKNKSVSLKPRSRDNKVNGGFTIGMARAKFQGSSILKPLQLNALSQLYYFVDRMTLLFCLYLKVSVFLISNYRRRARFNRAYIFFCQSLSVISFENWRHFFDIVRFIIERG